jgi:hypothetical protein
MAAMIVPEKSGLLRLMFVQRVPTRRNFRGAPAGKGHWPSPKKVL